MILNPSIIAPSQDFLKPKTIDYIFECLAKGMLENLPPTPIVIRNGINGYIAVDGHNLLAVYCYLGKDIEVHIAKSKYDGLKDESLPSLTRNQELENRFETALLGRESSQAKGINNFTDLIARYKDLFDIHAAKVLTK